MQASEALQQFRLTLKLWLQNYISDRAFRMLIHGLSQCDIRLGTHRPINQPKLLMKLDGK